MNGLLIAVMAALLLTACVSFPEAPAASQSSMVLDDTTIESVDGAKLALKVWRADAPRAVVVGVHGMNDYSQMFDGAASWWATNSAITTYAYDQRGFGRSPDFGLWAGAETMKTDLRAVVNAISARHPDLPIYIVAHSMGAGVTLAAMADGALGAEGAILVAPGIWGGSALPLFYRMSANLAAGIAPGKTLTGERAGRQATDNIEILREMLKDPHVIKETRLDAVLGVTRVMGEGWAASKRVGGLGLVLVGDKDEIIPVEKQLRLTERMCGEISLKVYPDGWHMLLRDIQAETVWRDVAIWISGNSGKGAPQALARGVGPAALFCGETGSEPASVGL